MPTLLQIDSSPMDASNSFSRRLTGEFVRHWRDRHPDGAVVVRDLAATSLPVLSSGWVAAAYTPEESRTPEQRSLLALSDELIAELQSADEYVIGVPMHNFSISGVLKLWIDQVARAGKTFTYAGGAPAGLLRDKHLTLIVTSGGSYEPGTPQSAMDFTEPYLRSVFGFLGVTDIRIVRAGGTSSARDDSSRAALLQSAGDAIRAQLHVA
jgi:FMN-dependent NADH-azoreductase